MKYNTLEVELLWRSYLRYLWPEEGEISGLAVSGIQFRGELKSSNPFLESRTINIFCLGVEQCSALWAL